MRETLDLIRAWKSLPAGAQAVLTTVVGTQGSTYRRSGARMLITSQGWAAGSISGGCLEGDLLRTAWERTETGPALVTYDSTADEDIVWGFGLGCNGLVQVLIERLPRDGGVIRLLDECVSNRRPLTLATCLEERRLGERTHEWEAPGERPSVAMRNRWLIEHIFPPRPLLIFGAGHDAAPLAEAAKAVGWHVTVVDGRAAFAVPERFPSADRVLNLAPHRVSVDLRIEPQSAAVVMTHNFLNDLALLRALLPSPVAYIGLLGPRRRSDRLLHDLAGEGLTPTPDQLAKMHAPIGLDVGAEGPHEIAVAIVGEIQAFFAGRPAGHLNGSVEPLHPPAGCLLPSSTPNSPTTCSH